MYSCREARTQDFAVICTFPQNAEELFHMYPKASMPLTPEQLISALQARTKPTVVVDQADHPVAYANIYGMEEGVGCWLGNVIVAPDHRGKGASKCLIQHMQHIAKHDLNMPKLQLICHHTNPKALLFYSKLGFKPFGIRRMEGRNGETAVGIEMAISLQECRE